MLQPKFFLTILWCVCFSPVIAFGQQSGYGNTETTSVFSPLKQTPDAYYVKKDNASGDTKEEKGVIKKNNSTSVKTLDEQARPAIFNRSNNLIKKPGSFQIARGEMMYIEGRVTDAFGVPINNAIISIWQTNAAGEYQNLLDKYSEFIDHYFSMSGKTTTDNLGRYGFISIFPGFYDDRTPHVHMIIAHKKFGTIETEMYFYDHPRNNKDPIYLSYNEEYREMLTAKVRPFDPYNPDEGKICNFNIVMDGIHMYKSF